MKLPDTIRASYMDGIYTTEENTDMQENKEIKALFHLIDDPDQDVFCLSLAAHRFLWQGIIPTRRISGENTIAAGSRAGTHRTADP